jgi:hypothetical protein
MPDLVNAVMAKMPNATDATRAQLRAMSRSSLEALVHGLHANSEPALRTHSQQRSHVESIPADELEAMVPKSSFRANKNLSRGRYQPSPVRVHSGALIPAEHLAMAPMSSFRPNARIAGQNRGGEFKQGKPQTREDMELELAEELHTHAGPPSTFVRNPRIRRTG